MASMTHTLLVLFYLVALVVARGAAGSSNSGDTEKVAKSSSSYTWTIVLAILGFVAILAGTASIISKCTIELKRLWI